MKGYITEFRVLKNRNKYPNTLGFERPYTQYPMKTHYRKEIPWTQGFAIIHKLGEWGEWSEIPFLFIPVRNMNGKWCWGRGVYVQYKPHGVDFEQKSVDAEMRFDTHKNIFVSKLKGGA